MATQSSILFFFHYFFYFIFSLYNIVLVLPYINMNLPQVYTCSPSWTLLLPPSPYYPSGSSQQSSILAFRIPWTEELGRLQSMGLQRVWHVWCYLAAPRAISRGEVFHQFILPLTEIHLKNTKTPFFFSSYGGMFFFRRHDFFKNSFWNFKGIYKL